MSLLVTIITTELPEPTEREPAEERPRTGPVTRAGLCRALRGQEMRETADISTPPKTHVFVSAVSLIS
jgi:hypothetical protein